MAATGVQAGAGVGLVVDTAKAADKSKVSGYVAGVPAFCCRTALIRT